MEVVENTVFKNKEYNKDLPQPLQRVGGLRNWGDDVPAPCVLGYFRGR